MQGDYLLLRLQNSFLYLKRMFNRIFHIAEDNMAETIEVMKLCEVKCTVNECM